MYKSSFYNLFVPVTETNEYLLFNTYTGGLLTLDKKEGEMFSQIMSYEQFSLEDIPAQHRSLVGMLQEKGYIVPAGKDEKEEYTVRYQERVNRLFYSEQGTIVITLATTNACNMQCPYCFEFTKQNNLFDDKLIDKLEKYLESVVQKSPHVKKWAGLGMTWYGGEPLLGKNVIGKLTPKLVKVAEKYNMKYSAEIITNGILLTKDTWEFLKENKVKWAQVTVDGVEKIHNKHRPLKNKQARNYEQILENIANMPEGLSTTIRINTDKEVVANFEKFLDDLYAYGIWPQRYREINLSVAWLRTYDEANESNLSERITMAEWPYYHDLMRKMKFNYFNRWAEANGVKKGQLAFNVEKPSFEDCWSVISPFSFVIDADGYTHKCWESVHDKNTRIQHISEEYQIEKYKKQLNYSRFDGCKESRDCKYIPICGMVSCTQHRFSRCPYSTNDYEESLLKEYLQYKQNKADIVFK